MRIHSYFEPTEPCCQCGAQTYYSQDNRGEWWCTNCAEDMPEEFQTFITKSMKKTKKKIALYLRPNEMEGIGTNPGRQVDPNRMELYSV